MTKNQRGYLAGETLAIAFLLAPPLLVCGGATTGYRALASAVALVGFLLGTVVGRCLPDVQ